MQFDYLRAFSRNIGILSTVEQLRLRDAVVAIPGCGGVGGLHALTLARMGFGGFVLADFDCFEVENMNRQYGAKMSTLGRHKAEVIASEVLDINPTARTRVHRDGVTAENVDEFLKGVDVVVDSLDFFAFEARSLVFGAARERGIPVVTGAPLGLSCALLTFTREGMSYADYFAFTPDDSAQAKAVKLAMGLAPRATHLRYMNPQNIDLAAGQGPSSIVGVNLCAAMAAGEAMKLVLARGGVRAAPHFTQFDTYRGVVRRGYLWRGNRNPVQQLKLWAVQKFFFGKKEKAA